MNLSQPDLSLLQDIPPCLRYYDIPRVSITATGLFSMNTALRRQAGDQRKFRVKISPDGRCLALYLCEPHNVRFSDKGGYVFHHGLLQLLREKGFMPPVVYDLEWNPDEQAWIGLCRELPAPPDLSSLPMPEKASRVRHSRKARSV